MIKDDTGEGETTLVFEFDGGIRTKKDSTCRSGSKLDC